MNRNLLSSKCRLQIKNIVVVQINVALELGKTLNIK